MASSAKNKPVSHITKGQSGRAVGSIIRRAGGKKNGSSERRGMRQKIALRPSGADRFPNGGPYFPMGTELDAFGNPK